MRCISPLSSDQSQDDEVPVWYSGTFRIQYLGDNLNGDKVILNVVELQLIIQNNEDFL